MRLFPNPHLTSLRTNGCTKHQFPHKNDSTVGQNRFFLILFLLNVQYKPAFLSSLYLPSIFMPFPLFSKFYNTQLQKHSQNFHTHPYYYHVKSAEPVTRLKHMKEQNKVLFMGSKYKYYLFLSSKYHNASSTESAQLHPRPLLCTKGSTRYLTG